MDGFQRHPCPITKSIRVREQLWAAHYTHIYHTAKVHELWSFQWLMILRAKKLWTLVAWGPWMQISLSCSISPWHFGPVARLPWFVVETESLVVRCFAAAEKTTWKPWAWSTNSHEFCLSQYDIAHWKSDDSKSTRPMIFKVGLAKAKRDFT